jgi:hypothetical protein
VPNYKLVKVDAQGEVTPQYGFYKSRNKIQVFGGAFANGKTTALAIKGIGLARDYPGSTGLLARETFPKLNDTLRKVFFDWCPPSAIRRMPTADDNTCYFHNGSTINFRYIAQRGKSRSDGSTTSNLLSATYDWIGIDQIEDPGIVSKDFDDLLGRLRGQTPYRPPEDDDETMPPDGPRWLMATCNPSQGWFYKEVVQPFIIWRDRGVMTDNLLINEDTATPILDLFEGSTYTNKSNLADDYIRSLEIKYRGQMRERYLLGKWAAFEGLVHPDFSMERNVLTRGQGEAHLFECLSRHVRPRVIEGYDFGIAAPTCYIYGFVDDLGRVVLTHGFYKPEFDYTRHAPEIFKIRNDAPGALRVNEALIADPAIFRRQVVAGRGIGTNVASLLREAGLEVVPGASDILSGLAKVNSYIAGTMQTPHIVTGEVPGPMLYVVDELDWFMDEIFSYYWKRNPQGQHIDDPVDNNDHAMNVIKYMLSHLPDPSEIVVPKNQLPPKWLYWHEMEPAHG